VAIGSFTDSSAVITGLIVAVISMVVAWATSFLKPPVVQEAEGARIRIVTDFDPEDIHDLEDTHDR
jgi:DHA1 family inner membrane transport protein